MANNSKTFHLTIARVGENMFDGEAVSVTLPGTDGVFTIMAHHEAYVSPPKAPLRNPRWWHSRNLTQPSYGYSLGLRSCLRNNLISSHTASRYLTLYLISVVL
jgi:hypothetical protein